MATELIRKCKDCGKDVRVAKAVVERMVPRGLSWPERCPECRKAHQDAVRSIKNQYFMLGTRTDFSTFDYYRAAYTHHGSREPTPAAVPEVECIRTKIKDEHIKRLYRLLERNQVVVLSSPTGTGKSLTVFHRLIEPPDWASKSVRRILQQGQIIQTQPLTEAVRGISVKVGRSFLHESGVGPMQSVGFRHSGSEEHSGLNLGVEVTDGSMRNWFRQGYLGRYSVVMIDEAHKRTLNIESLLIMLRNKLPQYPHLRLIIASATIDTEEFKEFFESEAISVAVLDLAKHGLADSVNYTVHFWLGNPVNGCKCWLCAGGTSECWGQRPSDTDELVQKVGWLVGKILDHTTEGGILVFLPGQSEIQKVADIIRRALGSSRREDIPVVAIYSKLGEEEVNKRFNEKGGKRRVLLTTDIAETSHTLDDLMYVVDSGYIKESQWSSAGRTASLSRIRHSKAGCRQRWGRVGRTQPGYVYCLYTSDEFNDNDTFKEQTTPEVFRSSLDEVVLTLRAAGVPGEPTPLGSDAQRQESRVEIARSLTACSEGGLLDETGNITDEGIAVFRGSLSPSDKALLHVADEQQCLLEMLTALLMMKTEEGDARTGPRLYSRASSQVENLGSGLLLWHPEWTAETKEWVWTIHQALRAGCQDDLDLALKLAFCYERLRASTTSASQWARYHLVNEKALAQVLKKRDALLETYRTRCREDPRRLDLQLLTRVRSIFTVLLPDNVVSLRSEGGNLVYGGSSDGSRIAGLLPPDSYRPGQWREKDTAVVAWAIQRRVVVDGRTILAPAGSFLVRPPNFAPYRPEWLLADQAFPVGSVVQIGEGAGAPCIERLAKYLRKGALSFVRRLGRFEQSEEENGEAPPSRQAEREELVFEEAFLWDAQLPALPARWKDTHTGTLAEIEAWVAEDSGPVAVVTPTNDSLQRPDWIAAIPSRKRDR